MKKLLLITVTFILGSSVFSQIPLTVLPSGGNKKAMIGEQIGLTKVVINYDRPAVKGREGKIWGQLVHTGFINQDFGSATAAPWRAGANENTTIEFSTDVKIEGKNLSAGKYGFFISYEPNECTIIFSNNSSSWGSYYYNEKEDALRVKVKPTALDKSVEWMKYEFSNESENSATISLLWEKLSISFKVEVDYIKTQLELFRNELRTDKGFIWQSWAQAADWCLQRNVNLNEALLWADSATSAGFEGDKSFRAWSTKAEILEKLGKTKEAAEVIKKAMPIASMTEVHRYGRQLLAEKKIKEALEIFKLNSGKYPNEFTTLMGLVRGYSANGDYSTALKYAEKALPLAPDTNNKSSVKGMIDKLKTGKDIN